MRLEAAARMDLFRKLWEARKLIVVVFIPLSLLPLPLIHPTSVSKDTWLTVTQRSLLSLINIIIASRKLLPAKTGIYDWKPTGNIMFIHTIIIHVDCKGGLSKCLQNNVRIFHIQKTHSFKPIPII